jgi:hypothetical protein
MRLEELGQLENFNELMETRTRNSPTCSMSKFKTFSGNTVRSTLVTGLGDLYQ